MVASGLTCAQFLRVLRRLVAPGGAMALSTINRTPRSYAMAIGAAEHVLGMPRSF